MVTLIGEIHVAYVHAEREAGNYNAFKAAIR